MLLFGQTLITLIPRNKPNILNPNSILIRHPEKETPIANRVENFDQNFVTPFFQYNSSFIIIKNCRIHAVQLPNFLIIKPDFASIVATEAELNFSFVRGIDIN